jgi:uncharacterized protein YjgD (DUF1641 family)
MMLTQDDMEGIKHVVDTVSVITVVGTLVDALPAIAALLSIVWTLIRIFESETIKNLLNKFRRPK